MTFTKSIKYSFKAKLNAFIFIAPTLKEESSQTNVILQYKLLAAILRQFIV